MNATRAKSLRRLAYGDLSRSAKGRTYLRHDGTGQILNGDERRRKYRTLKRAYKAFRVRKVYKRVPLPTKRERYEAGRTVRCGFA